MRVLSLRVVVLEVCLRWTSWAALAGSVLGIAPERRCA
jgi:hypothetical protein